MARLRDPVSGCAWDRQQNFRTIAPYTVEEAYEVVDAINRNDMADLAGELGDLLLQVVFHSQIATEIGAFDLTTVTRRIADKMEKRHPHIFSNYSVNMTVERWEELKAAERSAVGVVGALTGVAKALPAAMRAEKLQARAARVGFDWPDVEGPISKVHEELDELRAATDDDRLVEAGDFLFAAVNVVRAFGIDAETALREANDKFERRFAAMEKKAGGTIAGLDAAGQNALWNAVKAEGL